MSGRRQGGAGSGGAIPRRAVFTIASANYIALAATLMQSVREIHPEVARFIVLADTPRRFPGLDLAAEIIDCAVLEMADFRNMRFWYNVLEFNTALKPFAFRYLMAERGFTELCYLDPDILLLAPLRAAFSALAKDSMVLTPHILKPLQDGKEPSDLTIMKSGVYNLGFLALHDDGDTRQLLDWWAERCIAHCRIDIAGNMFTDQRWMDLAPALVPRTLILRDPGYNVAYWNLAHRPISRAPDGTWQAAGVTLVFFHFSGLAIDDPNLFSRHQDRFDGRDLGELGDLVERYRDRVRGNGWARYRAARYGFATFPDGRPIENAMRRWILRAIDEGRFDADAPITVTGEFFDAPDEVAGTLGIVMTRFMYQLWLDRPDLRAVFDIYTPTGQAQYFAWFAASEAREQGIDGRSIAAAVRLAPAPPPAREASSPSPPPPPPWPPLAGESWSGPADAALAAMGGDIIVEFGAATQRLPREAALAWEARADLARHFPLSSPAEVQDFLAWMLTEGVVQDLIDPARLSPALQAELTRISELSRHYQDVPLSELMLLTRRHTLPGSAAEARERFPSERVGRLSHGLWFAFVAPARYHWPEALVATVRAWFMAPTEIGCPGLAFNRAELAIWEMRPDLQQAFPLFTPEDTVAYLHWLLSKGLAELGLDPMVLDPRLADFLLQASPRHPRLPRALEMIHAARADLRALIDLDTEEGIAALLRWCETHYLSSYGATALGALLPTPPRAPLSALGCPGFAFTAAQAAIWQGRDDLRAAFPPDQPDAAWGFLHWLLSEGAGEAGVAEALRDPRLPAFLASPSPRYPDLPVALEMLHAARADLRAGIDLGAADGVAALRHWADLHFGAAYAGTPLAGLSVPAAPASRWGSIGRAGARKTRLLLSGMWSALTGRGEDLRGSAAALLAVGFSDFLVLDRATGTLHGPDGVALPAADGGIEAAVHLVHLNADTAFQDARFFARRGVRAGRSIGFWAWELETLPRRWRHAFSFFDEIWAVSHFAALAFAREALRPVRAMPLAITLPEPTEWLDRAGLGLTAQATLFLCMFDFRSYASRKNPEAVVEAFIRAFPSGDEAVRLLIKTQGGESAPRQWQRLIDLAADRRIELRDMPLDRAELVSLIAAADAFVSLHRAEGFGRGPAEAMWLGKPVILTAYSGTNDFATPETAFLVSYQPVPVPPDAYPGVEGQSWAEPDISEAALFMRTIHAQPMLAQGVGARAKARVQAIYHPQIVGQTMCAALGFAPEQSQPKRSRPGAAVSAAPRTGRRARP